jgi:hypothetical protein
MPILEALDNDGKPTGVKKHFTSDEYNRLKRLKSPKWILSENEKPKVREPFASPYPTDKDGLLKFIAECDERDTLVAIGKTDGRKVIREAAETRLQTISNQ